MIFPCEYCRAHCSVGDQNFAERDYLKIRCKRCGHKFYIQTPDADPTSRPDITSKFTPQLFIPSSNEWYYDANGEAIGPLPLDHIQKQFDDNAITAETYIWTDGMEDWVNLSSHKHLFGYLSLHKGEAGTPSRYETDQESQEDIASRLLAEEEALREKEEAERRKRREERLKAKQAEAEAEAKRQAEEEAARKAAEAKAEAKHQAEEEAARKAAEAEAEAKRLAEEEAARKAAEAEAEAKRQAEEEAARKAAEAKAEAKRQAEEEAARKAAEAKAEAKHQAEEEAARKAAEAEAEAKRLAEEEAARKAAEAEAEAKRQAEEEAARKAAEAEAEAKRQAEEEAARKAAEAEAKRQAEEEAARKAAEAEAEAKRLAEEEAARKAAEAEAEAKRKADEAEARRQAEEEAEKLEAAAEAKRLAEEEARREAEAEAERLEAEAEAKQKAKKKKDKPKTAPDLPALDDILEKSDIPIEADIVDSDVSLGDFDITNMYTPAGTAFQMEAVETEEVKPAEKKKETKKKKKRRGKAKKAAKALQELKDTEVVPPSEVPREETTPKQDIADFIDQELAAMGEGEASPMDIAGEPHEADDGIDIQDLPAEENEDWMIAGAEKEEPAAKKPEGREAFPSDISADELFGDDDDDDVLSALDEQPDTQAAAGDDDDFIEEDADEAFDSLKMLQQDMPGVKVKDFHVQDADDTKYTASNIEAEDALSEIAGLAEDVIDEDVVEAQVVKQEEEGFVDSAKQVEGKALEATELLEKSGVTEASKSKPMLYVGIGAVLIVLLVAGLAISMSGTGGPKTEVDMTYEEAGATEQKLSPQERLRRKIKKQESKKKSVATAEPKKEQKKEESKSIFNQSKKRAKESMGSNGSSLGSYSLDNAGSLADANTTRILKPTNGNGNGTHETKHKSTGRATLSSRVIQSVVNAQTGRFKYCYESYLREYDNAGGRMIIQFSIKGNGRTSKFHVSNKEFRKTSLEQCVRQVVKILRFPKFDGPAIPVKYPLDFQRMN